jgi:hypothetical protein
MHDNYHQPLGHLGGDPSAPLVRGATVVGPDGQHIGLLGAVHPRGDRPSDLLIVVTERHQLAPREYAVPVSAVTRASAESIHLAITREAIRKPE